MRTAARFLRRAGARPSFPSRALGNLAGDCDIAPRLREEVPAAGVAGHKANSFEVPLRARSTGSIPERDLAYRRFSLVRFDGVTKVS